MTSKQIGDALGEPIPDVIAPIIGYRYWKWDDRGLSSQRGTRWVPGEVLEAECLVSRGFGPREKMTDHASPSAPPLKTKPADVSKWDGDWSPTDRVHGEFGCGIYAYSTIEDAWRELHNTDAGTAILGEVEMWGNVWPHEHGYRAQFARPLALYRPVKASVKTIWGDPVERLAEFYGVEVKDMPLAVEERERIEAEAKKTADPYAINSRITYKMMSDLMRQTVAYGSPSSYRITTGANDITIPLLGTRSKRPDIFDDIVTAGTVTTTPTQRKPSFIRRMFSRSN